MINLTHFFNQKNLKKYSFLINKIHQLEDTIYKNISPESIAGKLLEIKANKTLKDSEKILHAMALAKKASQHVLGMSYYDVQLMGALALVDGCIAEMKTGEGKTLTCSAAVAANFVLGYSTHVATANEYLAERDQKTLEPLYSFLGITSSSSTSKSDKVHKKIAYLSNVIYSTAQELGFDFLRDNLVQDINEKVQPLDFSKVKAIIDEADFILIDEARTPLIISGEAPVRDSETYQLIREVSQQLRKMAKAPSESILEKDDYIPGDFWVDDKYKTVYLSDEGYENLEKLALANGLITVNPEHNNLKDHLSALYQNHNSWVIHEVLNALKAYHCYVKDKDYIVNNGEIIIVDQNTGRLSEGRTWSNGLHQAIETKEGVNINPETMTLGSISIQNYFRNYLKISGMSGTVMNSTDEFQDIYQTTTIQIPTNRKMIRRDHHDKIYLSMNAKYLGIIDDISERHQKGQPILIGTTSVAESEIISSLLTQKNIPHHVLNAKNNFREAQIIAQAGQPFAVTVSTSMAGRGTDIILGGNKEALLSILNEQLNAIHERAGFFGNLAQQLGLIQEGESTSEASEETVIIADESHIDHNDVQEKINALHDPQEITNILNSGIENVKNYLLALEKSVKKQIEVVESSCAKWREHVLDIGGLFVLGSSRNESRRIDDQLRGRAGRQGDPGESTFYLSIEDPWVNVFGKNPLFHHLAKSLPPNEALSSPIVTRAFAKAQSSIEAHHFNARKDTFQYDSIADEGRRQFLKFRDSLLIDSNSVIGVLKSSLIELMTPLAHPEFLDFMDEKLKLNLDDPKELLKLVISLPLSEIKHYTNILLAERNWINMKEVNSTHLMLIEETIDSMIAEHDSNFYSVLNSMSLRQLDKKWTDHLVFIDDARQNVAFSSLAQKNPLHEFKKLCFDSFQSMIEEFSQQVVEDFSLLVESQKETVFVETETDVNENIEMVEIE
jgi:preprotein translocase subunit SecA